ncbi:adenylate kinase [Lasiodiplodia theobromae]|uniref:adenylate kinase n=1 Tax=Lasiodiplodia theobromae TaxID=45133 RepID=UPI0015C3F32B|nr:adenylate kinase [Lasiodiplodia theobromae]KAF4546201.1 adenylate kinase [Lasiodiplodia theobromae]
MADALDIMRLVLEKEPELTGNTELFVDIWKWNPDTWSQKTWELMDLLCSRKVDLDLNEQFFCRIGVEPLDPFWNLSPDRERFLKLLLRQPEISVRVDEHCFEYLVKYGVNLILPIVSSLRVHTPVNRETVHRGYMDGYWQSILMHPCPSISLEDLATIVIGRYPPDAVAIFLRYNKNIQIDDAVLCTVVKRQDDHMVDVFRVLVDSGRLESDQVSHEVLLAALEHTRRYFARWTALFLAREWVGPEDDIFRVALKHHFEDGCITRDMCQSYSWLAEQGITVKLSDICDGALLDLRISQLGADVEATVDRYLEFCAKNMTWYRPTLRQFEETCSPYDPLSDSHQIPNKETATTLE